MNTKQTLAFLNVEQDLPTESAAIEGLGLLLTQMGSENMIENPYIQLKRTFNQSDFRGGFIRYWRVMGPKNHPNLGSDISIAWLQQEGYVR